MPSINHPSFLDFGAPDAASANPYPAGSGRAVLWDAGWDPASIDPLTDAEVARLSDTSPRNAARFVPPSEDLANIAEGAGEIAGRGLNAAASGLSAVAPWVMPAVGLALAVYVWSVIK